MHCMVFDVSETWTPVAVHLASALPLVKNAGLFRECKLRLNSYAFAEWSACSVS